MPGRRNAGRLVTTLALLFLIAVGIDMVSNERYGESYSERQRKIWNEWLGEWRDKGPRRSGAPGSLLDEQYMARLAGLQENGSPDWDVSLPESVDIASLPLSGLTVEELLARAGPGRDPDACLLLACRPSKAYCYMLVERRRWLKRASELGRPGALFLVEVNEEQIRRAEKGMALTDRGDRDKAGLGHLEGYEEFKTLLSEGDVELYRTLRCIEPGVENTELRRIIGLALAENAERGDQEASYQLAVLEYFERNDPVFNGVDDRIRSELNIRRSPFWLWLEQYLHLAPKVHSPTRDACVAAAEQLRKAARTGDLHAMYLWITKGLKHYTYLDSEAWQDLIAFSSSLMEKGHASFMKELYPWDSSRIAFPESVYQYYYTASSWKRLETEKRRALVARGHDVYMPYQLYDLLDDRQKMGNASEEFEEQLVALFHRVRKICPDQLIRQNVYGPAFMNGDISGLKAGFVDVAQGMAAMGEPLAQLALADMTCRKWAKTDDPGRVVELLENVVRNGMLFNEQIFFERDGKTSFSSVVGIAADWLMDIYLSPEAPGEYRKKARDLAERYGSFEDVHVSQHGSKRRYYMGLIHERGIDVRRDINEALAWYQRGITDGEAACCVALGRLYEKGEGVGQDLARALEQYSRAVEWNDVGAVADVKRVQQAMQNE